MELLKQSDFNPIEKQMEQAGFKPERVKREISFAIQAINKSQHLQNCSRESLLQAVLNVSNIGLTLNPAAKESYLIPLYNSLTRSIEACLDPSYIGLVKLLTESGSVKSIVGQLIFSGDTFEVDFDNNLSPVMHKPQLSKEKRGEMIGVYALATLSNGTRLVEWMDKSEVDEIKKRSETYKAFKTSKIQSCTWVSDYDEMARKTIIKRIYNYLPHTEQMYRIDEAMNLDNEDYRVSDKQVEYIETLLQSSALDTRQKEWLEWEVPTMLAKRANEVIKMLLNNQPNPRDRIRNGELLSANDIRKAVASAAEMANT